MNKAITSWILELNYYKLNNYSSLPTKRVDDKAYWMHWQVISPEPLSKAINDIFNKVWKVPVIYLSPRWELLKQEKLEKLSSELDEFIIICWHYEWIDQRIIDKYVNLEISIWEYILSSWELATMVFVDSITRLLPWVLWNELSHSEESFSQIFNRQKEHSVYTRPNVFEEMMVPEVLLSWDHNKIQKWKFNNLT